MYLWSPTTLLLDDTEARQYIDAHSSAVNVYRRACCERRQRDRQDSALHADNYHNNYPTVVVLQMYSWHAVRDNYSGTRMNTRKHDSVFMHTVQQCRGYVPRSMLLRTIT